MVATGPTSTSRPRYMTANGRDKLRQQCQIVSDEEQREILFPLQMLEKFDDLSLNGDIESARWFVANQQQRGHRKGSCDTHALSLAAERLVRIALRVGSRQPDSLQQARSTILLIAGRSLGQECVILGSRDDAADAFDGGRGSSRDPETQSARIGLRGA